MLVKKGVQKALHILCPTPGVHVQVQGQLDFNGYHFFINI